MLRLDVLISVLAVILLPGLYGEHCAAKAAPNAPVPGERAKMASADVQPVSASIRVYSVREEGFIMTQRVIKTNDEWRQQLTSEQFRITRKKWTERAFSGKYWNHHEKGVYRCVCCGNDLFSSETKFDSGTGWPSFWAPIAQENIKTETDKSLFMERIEVLCSRCDAHLGHVFEDGPEATGLRYCINSASLKFSNTE